MRIKANRFMLVISPDQFPVAQDAHQASHFDIALGQFHCRREVSASVASVPRANGASGVAHEDESVLFHA